MELHAQRAESRFRELFVALARFVEIRERIDAAEDREVHEDGPGNRGQHPTRPGASRISMKRDAEEYAERGPAQAERDRAGDVNRDRPLPRLTAQREADRENGGDRRERAEEEPLGALEDDAVP